MMKSLYKIFAQIWVIAWGGSMFDAISTIFGVMTLGNIEKNPLVHYLIATYGVHGIMLYLPVETALYAAIPDRKSTRLNSSHSQISYAVFCLKKKKQCTVRRI